jgi:hypothetical protein
MFHLIYTFHATLQCAYYIQIVVVRSDMFKTKTDRTRERRIEAVSRSHGLFMLQKLHKLSQLSFSVLRVLALLSAGI